MWNIFWKQLLISLWLFYSRWSKKCYQCKQGDPTCFISPPSNGNVIDCKPEHNGCYIVYYLGKKVKDGSRHIK